jgi:aminopeptidase-like protein
MYTLAQRLFPIGRSLTGDGVRATLGLVSEWLPLELTEVPAGTAVYDWIVPPEWNVHDAWIADAEGRRLVDLSDSSLHVVGYSEPVNVRLRGADLQPRLHSLPERPDSIPYRTSYYERTWGFCVADRVRREIDDEGEYEVAIESSLDEHGSLTFGEWFLPGRGENEILVSTYVCHPSLANDNVAGIVVAAALARWLPPGRLRHGVRFVFAPSGVGTLAWLERNESRLGRVRSGVVVACAGDRGPLSYKRSRRGDAPVDRAAAHVLARRERASVTDFVPWGTDERQLCSPGFDLPVGRLARTPNGEYDEYHTSDDDLDFITSEHLADTLTALAEVIDVIDADVTLARVEPRGEPQLSRHSIEAAISRDLLLRGDDAKQALFWLLNLADGHHSLLDVAERSGLDFALLASTADLLLDAGLVREVGG